MNDRGSIMLKAKAGVESAFKSALTVLLEQKHLYQRVGVEVDELSLIQSLERQLRLEMSEEQKAELHNDVDRWLFSLNWIATEPYNKQYAGTGNGIVLIEFTHANMVCEACGRRNAFNTEIVFNVLNWPPPANEVSHEKEYAVNIFLMRMRCQSCKGVPEALLVKRIGDKLILTGRSTMEPLENQHVLPKALMKYYGGSIIAYNSGQHLPAIFMLRTTIERWMHMNTEGKMHVDNAIEAYMKRLPDDFKGRFPSMKALYGDLSADMHGAVGSEELFGRAKNEIVEHFEALRLFRLIGENELLK